MPWAPEHRAQKTREMRLRRLDHFRAYDQAKDIARRARYQAVIDEAKRRPCADCGRRFPSVVMDLDHRPGWPKVADASEMRRRGHSVEDLRVEIAKCDVVCANCHRLRTFSRLARKEA